MLRTSIVLRVLGLAGLLYALVLARRQYIFQHFLKDRFITSDHFPANYVKVLNESVAKHEQPPLDFDYASTFTDLKIPRTIHFIWFQNLYSTHDGGSQIPAAISHAPDLCRKFNPDYEINIWNATGARDFFEQNYSWFIPTYDNYRYPIQRIDALKYFVLYHYGGVYMDLDIACRRPLDPLLDFPAWFPEASPLGVNNDLFAAAKAHPILKRMTLELERHNKNWLFPYLTIFWSTGPQFSSDILKEWFEHYGPAVLLQGTNGAKSDPAAFFILPQIYYSEEFTFFGHSPGGTWHGGDVAVILWFVAHPWALLLIIAVAAAAAYKYRQSRRAMAWNKAEDRSNAV